MAKETKYLLIRFFLLSAAWVLLYYLAPYLLPQHIREDQYSFIAELEIIIKALVFTCVVFLLVITFEIYFFKRTKQLKLKKKAIYLNAFVLMVTLLIVGFAYINGFF